MILTGVHRNPDLMITQAYREISPASGRIWALAALTEAYFDKYEVWKWTEVHVNDPMLVETFSSGRKCKIAVGATLQDTFREYSERLRKYSVNRCFRRNMIRFFFNRKCGNLGKNLPLWHRKKKNWQHCKFSVYLRFYRGRLPMSKKQVYILTAAAE